MTITLATLPQATEQQVFDQIAKHLLTQARKCIEKSGCRYHGFGDERCAAGCLIAEDEYKPEMEGYGWSNLAHKYKLVPDAHFSLIVALQEVHDHWMPKDWPNELRSVAISYHLDCSVVHQLEADFYGRIADEQ